MSDVEQPFYFFKIDLSNIRQTLADAMPPGIQLRSVSLPSDWRFIADLYNAAFDLPFPGKVTAQQILQYASHPGFSPLSTFLAFKDDLAVGLGVARVSIPAPGGGGNEGAIELLAVRPGYRHLGIGRALTRRMVDWLSTRGITDIFAATYDTTVVRLLEKYGFRLLPQRNE